MHESAPTNKANANHASKTVQHATLCHEAPQAKEVHHKALGKGVTVVHHKAMVVCENSSTVRPMTRVSASSRYCST